MSILSNTSRSATNFQLNKLFSEYGEVTSAKIVFDKLKFGSVENLMRNDQKGNFNADIR